MFQRGRRRRFGLHLGISFFENDICFRLNPRIQSRREFEIHPRSQGSHRVYSHSSMESANPNLDIRSALHTRQTGYSAPLTNQPPSTYLPEQIFLSQQPFTSFALIWSDGTRPQASSNHLVTIPHCSYLISQNHHRYFSALTSIIKHHPLFLKPRREAIKFIQLPPPLLS